MMDKKSISSTKILSSKKRLLSIFFVFLLLIPIFSSTIGATQTIANEQVIVREEKKESGDDKSDTESSDDTHGEVGSEIMKDSCMIYGEGSSDYEQCKEDRKASSDTPQFIKGALYSLNDTVREKEKNEDYIKNFSNSAQTGIAYDIDLLDGETIIMHIMRVVISLIEMIGAAITVVTFLVFNAAVAEFWSDAVRGVFDVIDDAIFDWSNPNSIFMKLLIFFTVFAIFKRLLSSFKNIHGAKGILQIILSCALSAVLVYGVARYGKPTMDYIESTAMSFLTETVTEMTKFDESYSDAGASDEYEIQVKRMLFDVMQLQGFRLRHFGVTGVSDIAAPSKDYNADFGESLMGNIDSAQSNAQEMWENNSADLQYARFRILLEDPSKSNTQNERKYYGSTAVIYNWASSLMILLLSFFFFVHRILIAGVIIIACMAVLAVSILKEILLSVSLYALIRVVFDPDKRNALMWFVNRFIWMIIAALSKVVLVVIIFMMIQLINTLSSQSAGLLVVLPFDAVVLFAMIMAGKNAPMLLQKVLATFGGDGAGVVSTVARFTGGDMTPSQLLENAKEQFPRLGNKNDEDEDEDEDGDSDGGSSSLDKVGSDDLDEYEDGSDDAKDEEVEDDSSAKQHSDQDETTDDEETKEGSAISKTGEDEEVDGDEASDDDSTTATTTSKETDENAVGKNGSSSVDQVSVSEEEAEPDDYDLNAEFDKMMQKKQAQHDPVDLSEEDDSSIGDVGDELLDDSEYYDDPVDIDKQHEDINQTSTYNESPDIINKRETSKSRYDEPIVRKRAEKSKETKSKLDEFIRKIENDDSGGFEEDE